MVNDEKNQCESQGKVLIQQKKELNQYSIWYFSLCI